MELIFRRGQQAAGSHLWMKTEVFPWRGTPWERASLLLFPRGNGAFAGSCAALHHLPRACLAADQLLLLPCTPGWAQPPIPGLIPGFVALLGRGHIRLGAVGHQKCSAWSCRVCWAEVNKPRWRGQRERLQCQPRVLLAAGISPAGKSERVWFFFFFLFWDLWVVRQTLLVLSCPQQRFPCVPLSSGHPRGLSWWNLPARAGK